MFEGRGIFNEYRWIISRVQWLLDGIVVVLLLFLVCSVYGETFRFRWQALGLIAFFLTIMVFRVAELYQPWRGANLMRLVRRVFLAWIVIVAILLALAFFTKTSIYFSRKVLFTWMTLVPAALVVLRLKVYWGLRWLRQQGRNSRTVVIAGAGDLGQRLAKNVVDTPWLGMRLLGFFDDRVTGTIHLDHHDYPVLGSLDDMIEFVKRQEIVMVYLALPLRAEDRLREVVDALQDTTASVYYVPDALIAGHPNLMDTIPTFARRRAFATYELAHPWSRGYWARLNPRLHDLFQAYYAADFQVVVDFCRKYGIAFLIVDDRHFSPAFLKGGDFLFPYDKPYIPGTSRGLADLDQVPFFAPFDKQIRQLTAGRHNFALLSDPRIISLSVDQHIRLIDMRPWLTQKP